MHSSYVAFFFGVQLISHAVPFAFVAACLIPGGSDQSAQLYPEALVWGLHVFVHVRTTLLGWPHVGLWVARMCASVGLWDMREHGLVAVEWWCLLAVSQPLCFYS